MELRVARHTNHLETIIEFYTTNLELEILGSFKNHDNYDGVFLGKKNEKWHLEFTKDQHPPLHHFDEDDLLVFYFSSEKERNKIRGNFIRSNVSESIPKNPYWKQNGIYYLDPDGFGIILAIR